MDFTRISSTTRLVLVLMLHTWSYTYVSTNSTSSPPSTSVSTSTTSSTSSSTSTSVSTSTTITGTSSTISTLPTTSSSSVTTRTKLTTAPPSTTTTLSSVTSHTTTTAAPLSTATTSSSVTTHTAMTIAPPSTHTSMDTDNANTTRTSVGASDTTVTSKTSTAAGSTSLPSTTPITTTDLNTASHTSKTSSMQSTAAVSTPLPSTTPIITTTAYNGCNGTHTCDVNAYCNDTMDGGHNCTCKDGFKGDGVNCTDLNECSHNDTNSCHVHADCYNTNGSYNCSCKNGFTGNGFNCTDINECKGTHKCDMNADCNNTDGSYNCTCKGGFRGDGFNCTDFNECSHNDTNHCHVHADCYNTNGSYNCSCKKGFDGDGFNCTDINECSHNDTNRCHVHADCYNTNGSYNCSCNKWFDGDGFNCTDIDECNNKTACDITEYCVNQDGGYSCKCKPGSYRDENSTCTLRRFSYIGYVKISTNATNFTILTEELQKWLKNTVFKNLSGLTYIEILIDGTAYTNRRSRRETPRTKNITYILHLKKETSRANIENLTNSYNSSCNNTCDHHDFQVDSFQTAQDSALCEVYRECDPHTTECEAAEGISECKCKKGFIRSTNPYFCEDVNECELDRSKCKDVGTCVNIPGSWSCNCTHGYVEDPFGQQCIDVCQSNPCKNNAKCEHGNRPGLYYCKCTPDWKGHDCTEAIPQASIQDNSEASKFRTILIAVGASLGSICFLLLIVTCRVCRRNQSQKHPERRPLSTHMNDYEMNEKKGTYQIPRAHVNNEDDRPSNMEDKQSTYHNPRAQVSNRDERLYAEIDGGSELNVLDERSSKQDKLEREPLTKSIKEVHGGAENRSFLHEEAERRRSQNPEKSGVDYF